MDYTYAKLTSKVNAYAWLSSYAKHLKRKKLENKIQKREKEDLNFDENHVSKKVRIETIKNKMENLSREQNLAIAFDLGWSESMNKKEISKLANQLARIHGANKKDENSAKIYFTNFKKTSDLYKECVRKHAGFEQFPIELRIVSVNDFLLHVITKNMPSRNYTKKDNDFGGEPAYCL